MLHIETSEGKAEAEEVMKLNLQATRYILEAYPYSKGLAEDRDVRLNLTNRFVEMHHVCSEVEQVGVHKMCIYKHLERQEW